MMNTLPSIRWMPALLVLLALTAPVARAQVVINVTTTADELNHSNGDCSLREAIDEANDANQTSEGDCTDGAPSSGQGFVIDLPPGTYTLSLAGASEDANQTGDLDLAPTHGSAGVPLTIRASGSGAATIDANGIDRVFDLQQVGSGSSYTVFFEALVITGGSTPASDANGGGIRVEEPGGAVVSVELTNVRVTGNTAQEDGGGLFLDGHDLTAARTTIDGNTAGASGEGFGGGIYANNDAALVNTTISGNSAASGGDALSLEGASVSISHSTIYDNSGFGAVFTSGASVVDYKNTILAGNTGDDCIGTVVFNSYGYNLIEDFTGGCDAGYTEVENAGTDLTDADPLLEALAVNDGNGAVVQWPTHALMAASPALDQGDGTTVEGDALTTDARGAPRTYDYPPVANAAGGSDIGAFEAQADELPGLPVATDDDYDVETGQTLEVSAPGVLDNDDHPDDLPLTAVLDDDVSDGDLTLNADGSFTYTPDGGFIGTDTFTYHASDGANDSEEATVTITVHDVNTPPVANGAEYSLDEDEVEVVLAPGILSNDTDADGDPLTAILVTDVSNGTLAFESDGSFTYTPNPNFNGIDTFTYRASDGMATSNVGTVTLTVHPVPDAPVANDNAYTIGEDQGLTVEPPGVLANDTDADADPLTAVLDTDVSNGTLALNADGSFTYTPGTNFNGTDTFTYQADDGTDTSNVATVTITVTPEADAPVANDDAYTIDEDQGLTVEPPGVLENDADGDGDPLTTTLVSGVSNGTLSLGADGSFTYTPDADFNGTDAFTYQASDGTATSNVATVTITVQPVDDAPMANDDTYSTGEEEVLTVAAPGVLANDTDADGDPLTAVLVTDVSNGTLAFEADGSFTYTPNVDFNGTDTFVYRIPEAPSKAGQTSHEATVSILVGGTNDVPVAQDDGYTTNEDQGLTVEAPGVLANDTDTDGDPLTTTLVSDVSSGILALEADGSFTYTPGTNFNGIDTFTYQAHDGTANSEVAEVTLQVNAVNDAPVANDDAASTRSNVPVEVEVLANDTDVDGAVDPASVQIETAPSNGTATVDAAAGTILFSPADGFRGTATLTYTVADGLGARSDTATVTITVQNQLPVARPDTVSTFPGVAVVIEVLANDSDPEDDPLSLDAVSTPESGTASINDDGTITYLSPTGFSGQDRFTYTIHDTGGSTASAEVVVHVDACQFDVVDLGTLGGAASRAFGINADGEVVGLSDTDDGSVQGFLWSGGAPIPLGGSRTSQALDIDDAIVGAAELDNVLRAVQFSSGAVDDLDTPAGMFSMAFGTQGTQAVGTYVEEDVFYPFLAREAFTRLDVPGGGGGQAMAVNEAGQAVGFSMAGQALSWQATGAVTVLGAGRAFGINEAGQVVGTSGDQAMLWQPDGTPVPLDPDGIGFAEAYDINDAGSVVGTAAIAAKHEGVGSWRTARDLFTIVQSAASGASTSSPEVSKRAAQGGAYLWRGGVVFDLNTCLNENAGWVLEDARAINNLGQIVGYGLHGGVQRAYRLTPRGNAAPAAHDDRVVTDAAAPVRIDVLANDTDADGDVLRVLRVLPSSAGTIITRADGSLTYQPRDGFAGEDRFVYVVTDGRGAADRAQVSVSVTAPAEQPTQYVLEQNYPNPFNPTTIIRYVLPEAGPVQMIVYDVLGQPVHTLVEGVQEAGAHTVTFQAEGLPSGVYVYRLKAGGHRLVRRMVLVR